jgi:hypothetical protein
MSTDHEEALRAARDSLRNVVSIRDFFARGPSRQRSRHRDARRGREQNPRSVGDTQRRLRKVELLGVCDEETFERPQMGILEWRHRSRDSMAKSSQGWPGTHKATLNSKRCEITE